MAIELWQQSATSLAAMIAARQTTSRAVIEAHLARIAAVNPAVNAIVTVLTDSALAAADAADAAVASGGELGPLHGVPITVKSNIDLTGTPTTHGVPAFAQAFPDEDAPVTQRMKAAGAIPIGRTNMPDMGLRVHTDSGLYGLTRNPFDGSRTSGGSSGGEGAALATGMSPLGLGNDIGGSLRNPAFACGIASLKPSLGRIPWASAIEPRSPVLAAQLMAVEGPMARHVGDLRLALSVLAGPHPRDPVSVPAPLTGPSLAGRIKVAVVTAPPGGATHPSISAGVRAAADALSDAGYDVSEITPPMVEEAIAVWSQWLAWEFGLMSDLLGQILSPDAMGFLKSFLSVQGSQDFPGSVQLQVRRHTVARAWSAFLADYPLILGPTWCQPQFPHGFDIAGPGSSTEVGELMRFVVPMNLLGLPVVCVPTGMAGGLPLGVQIIGDRFREDLCLGAGEAIEARLGHLTPIDPR
ncbi:indoleacetamide hydrolase [Polymorphobacter glacialis]|uniref:Indoleacetamide hydrolase n=1 Tax=Sandarakinorhabdus glacialis TaxID=1614636 RepID=A0A917EBJ3_9SPHN|nr:amidase [Polymorphobacter glacialis]GGE17340.1 indoleacetamide hydrolase [Polymorphobacter glacialis]